MDPETRNAGDIPPALNRITGQVVDGALQVHTRLGPGLLERVYRSALAYELRKRGFEVHEELRVPVVYDEVRFDFAFRADLLVERSVVVEVKTVQDVIPVHEAQLLTYLRLMNAPVGLLLNFNETRLRDGIFRRVNSIAKEKG